MAKKRFSLALAIFCIQLGLTADQVELDSGEILKGKLSSMQNNELIFESKKAGSVTLDWLNVTYLSTDSIMPIVLVDGRTLDGKIEMNKDTSLMEISFVFLPKETKEGVIHVDSTEILSINVKRPLMSSHKWSGRMGFGYSSISGNSSNSAFLSAANFQCDFYRYEDVVHTLNIDGYYNYRKANGKPSVNQGQEKITFRSILTPKVDWFFWQMLYFDRIAKLTIRADERIGIGYSIVDTDTGHFRVLGMASRVDSFYHQDSRFHNGFMGFGPGVDFSVTYRTFTLSNLTSWVGKLTNVNDYLVESLSSLSKPLSKRIEMSIKYRIYFVSDVPANTKKADKNAYIEFAYVF